jgi:MFS family permease
MFDRIRNSWTLLKASMAVLRADKELIVFPIVSAVAVLLVTATFALPMLLAGFADTLIKGDSQILGFVVGFAFYVVQYAVILFANSALVGAAMIRLRGGDPTVGDGFRIALQRIGVILAYALISATVGMILRALAERGKRVGRIISSIGGMAWNLVTYLVVPVLVVENVGPLEAIKRSANYLKRTWGEQIAGNFGLGIIFGLVVLLVILIAVPVFYLVIVSKSIPLIVVTAVVFVLIFVFLGLSNSTLNGIYVAAVYRYAAEGETDSFFAKEMVQGAFRPK